MPALAAGQYGGSCGVDISLPSSGASGIFLQCLYVCGVTAAQSPFEGPRGGDATAVWTLWSVQNYFGEGADALLLYAGPIQNVDPEVLQVVGVESRLLAAIPSNVYWGAYRRFEVSWGTSQWTAPGIPGAYQANGFVELKIDGAIIVTVTGEDRIHARNYNAVGTTILVEDKWNSIRYSGGRAIDNLYFTDTADYNSSTPYFSDACEAPTVFLDQNIYFNNGFTDFYDTNNELNNNTRYADYVDGVGNPGRGIATPGAEGFAGFVIATWMFSGTVAPYINVFAPRANGVSRTAICGFVATAAPPTPNDRRLDLSWVAFDVPDDDEDDDDDGDGDEIPGDGCPAPDPAVSVPDDCAGTGPLQND